jgi:hypothetical protein
MTVLEACIEKRKDEIQRTMSFFCTYLNLDEACHAVVKTPDLQSLVFV